MTSLKKIIKSPLTLARITSQKHRSKKEEKRGRKKGNKGIFLDFPSHFPLLQTNKKKPLISMLAVLSIIWLINLSN